MRVYESAHLVGDGIETAHVDVVLSLDGYPVDGSLLLQLVAPPLPLLDSIFEYALCVKYVCYQR